MNILALMPDAYGGFGGIAQYNRDLLDSLSGLEEVGSVLSVPRLRPGTETRLPRKVVERPTPGGALNYVRVAIRLGFEIRPDLILCGHVNLMPVAALLKKCIGSPVVLEAYGIEVWNRPGRVHSWAVGQVDLVISISRYTRERLITWSGLPPHRVKVIPNAIHRERYRPGCKPPHLVERYGVGGKRVLLTVGRLSGRERYKGHDRIISSLPKLSSVFPDLVYVIAGGGDDTGRLEDLAVAHGVRGRVIFTGRISEEEKVDHYNLADAFAMPSTGEGFGFVFLEASACHVPVLGGSKDGSRDALLDGRLGTMVDPDDPDELLAGLVEVLRKDRSAPGALHVFDQSRFEAQIRSLFSFGQRALRAT
ncbi:MAG TPA: glycosyltransferase family 4 protein [Chloroflexia bacterium]|nr:glycosyltransferase family 4 protein [Chloroflexia bacterium]